MASAHSFSFSVAARNEARDFVRLMKSGESAAQIRNTIVADRGCSPSMATFRREILLAFESQRIWRKPRAEVGPDLRLEIVRLLKRNHSLAQIAQALHVSGKRVWRLARSLQASTWKRGRGRRFLPEQVKAIREAIKSGKSSLEIERQFHCSSEIVKRERLRCGDMKDHRFDHKLSVDQVAEIRSWLAQPPGSRTMTWKEVAAKYGICVRTISFIKRHEYGY